MRVSGIVSREVVWAVLRIETVNQTSRPWTVERVVTLTAVRKGCDSVPAINSIRRAICGAIDSDQGYAGAITVGAVGGDEVIKVEVDFSQQSIAIAASVTSKRVVRDRIDVNRCALVVRSSIPTRLSPCKGAIPFDSMRYHLLPLRSVVKRSTT